MVQFPWSAVWTNNSITVQFQIPDSLQPTMPECRVSRTARPVACQHCRDRLARGDLRLDLLRPGGTVKAVYHAGCAFSPTVQLSLQVGHIIVGLVCSLIRLIIFRIRLSWPAGRIYPTMTGNWSGLS